MGRSSWFKGAAAAFAALVVALVATAAAGAKARAVATPVAAPAFTAAEQSAPAGDDWVVVHGNLQATNYSSLTQVSPSNVGQLKQAWQVHLASYAEGSGAGNSCATSPQCSGEGNALVYKGVMYIQTGSDDVFAIDGATGQKLWAYHPGWDPGFTKVGGVSRGIAMGDGRLYVPQIDGKLVALDMTTGGVVWVSPLGNWHDAYQITAPPVYYDHMVVIGMSGGDSGNSDYLTAVDAAFGNVIWHWNVVPRPGDPGYKTWGNKTAYHVAGGAIWDAVSIDPKLDMVYVGTGNVVPWNTRPPGNELYTDSIVALNAHTGSMKWYYQTTHHDVWDDDIPATSVLFDAPFRPYKIVNAGTWVDNPAKGFNGSTRQGQQIQYTGPATMQPALALASKMGFVFILNRKTGKPLIPTPEMKVDQTNGQGLNLSPTQPIPNGDYFTSQCVLPSQWNDPGPDGKPVQHGCSYTPVNMDHFVAIPHDEGEWMPSAYDPTTNNLYICTIDNRAWAMEALPLAQQKAVLKPGAGYLGILLSQGKREGYTGGFTAFNLLTQKITWRDNWADFCYSGATATASGLVFAGHNDGHVEAMDSKTGKSLWNSATAPAGANAPVMTYSANGKQYVSVLQGGDSHEQTPRGDLVTTWALP